MSLLIISLLSHFEQLHQLIEDKIPTTSLKTKAYEYLSLMKKNIKICTDSINNKNYKQMFVYIYPLDDLCIGYRTRITSFDIIEERKIKMAFRASKYKDAALKLLYDIKLEVNELMTNYKNI